MNSEGAVLACLLARQYIFDELIQMGLHCDMFTDGNVNLFNMIVKYRVENKVDAVVITNLPIETSTQSKLLDVSNDTKTYEYPQYFQQLEKRYIGREKTRILTAYGDTRKDCLKVAGHLIALAESGQIIEEDLATIIEETIKMIEERQADNYTNRYALGGEFTHFDALGHYESGSLMTLGGGSGHGKSTLALNLTLRWLDNRLKVLYFSNEMESRILLVKLVCIQTGLLWKNVMNSTGDRLTAEGREQAIEAVRAFKDLGLQIYTKNYSVAEMNLIIKTYKPDVFILDTINALIKADERVDIALGALARNMKSLAIETDALAILVAQLKDIHGRPTDKDLVKESRQIRDASDYMDFVYREFEQRPYSKRDILKNVIEIYRVKGRNTGIGRCALKFNGENGQINDFESWERESLKEYFDKNKQQLYKEE